MSTETTLQTKIRLALGLVPGLVIFRNNVGTATHVNPGTGREQRVAYGVGGPGGSDLIGCLRGRFIALEIKTEKGRVSAEQHGFLECVRANGGFAAIVRSVDDAVAAIERARRGEQC